MLSPTKYDGRVRHRLLPQLVGDPGGLRVSQSMGMPPGIPKGVLWVQWLLISRMIIRTAISIVWMTIAAVVGAISVCAPVHSARLTPATLNGVSGRPIRAWAVSRDQPNCFVGDQCNEIGAAHRSAAPAIMPSMLRLHSFFIRPLLWSRNALHP